MNGWPTAVARYSADTSQVVAAAPTPKERPMATRATATIEELTGFSTEPGEGATTNRGLTPVSPVPRARRPPAAGRRCREVSALLMQPSLPGPRTAKKTASFLAMTLPGTRPRRGVTLASWRRPAGLDR